MTAELVRGQNHPLPGSRLEIRVSAGRPVVAGATLSDAHGKVRGVEWVAHPGSPALPGLQVSRQAAADHRLAVDLDALPDAVHRVDVLLALPLGVAGPATFRGLAAPFVAVTGLDGTEIAGFTLTGLDAESAVIALELYRRQGAWKVRAVGQGYAGGLAEMLADQGLPEARELAAAIDDTVAQGLARSVPPPPPPPHLTEDPRTGPTAQAHQGTAHTAHQDPARRDPTHQDPRHQNLARQDPAHQDPAPQSPAHHGLQGPARQAQAHQDPARQAQAPQDPTHQGPAHHGYQGPVHPDHAPQGPTQGPSAPPPRRPAGESPAAPATSGDRAGSESPAAPATSGDRAGSESPAAPATSGDRAGSESPAAPATAGDRAAGGGPVDYTHPGRRATAPPVPPPANPPAEPGRPAQPVAGDATGWSMDERLYNQVWGMFEDLARTTAAYRSAVDFADSRREQELDKVLDDPRSRIGGAGDAARERARARHADLVGRARAALDRDLAQLTAEADVVEPALPPAFAAWSSPVWHAYRAPMEVPMALRLGDLHLPERPGLRIPMLVRLPLERGLWIDSGKALTNHRTDPVELRRLAMDTAVVHAARLLAVHPPREFQVHVIDPAGAATAALAPLVTADVLAGPPVSGAAGVTEVLARLTRRVDLVQMAIRGGAADALPPDLDTAEQLLIVNDFPHGFDDRAVTRLRYLADEGPAVGVHLMMVADREDAAEYGPLLDPLWRALLRLTPVPDDHLADPWVGHTWTYDPPVLPPGGQTLRELLARVATARRTGGR